jgi:plastocyanin
MRLEAPLRRSFLLPLLPLLAPAAAAQQFTQVSGAIPGTARWSEGVECADVDADGDLDLFFADGDGFQLAGTKRQNVLIVNKLEVAPMTFADESLARLGAHVSNAKMVVTGDVQGDGWVDALFCNAFATDPPFLYVNRGAAQPGFFDFEGAARGFTTNHSSGGAQFGDVDDDGDLDVILCDAYLGSVAAKPHLYLNDGNGVFTESVAFQAAAPTKSAQMDVQLVDVDRDFDLDFVGACRAENGNAATGDHYLMLNDGAGGFSDASSLVPDGSSGNVYEIDVGDLDGDRDVDLFLISLAGFGDGPVQNQLEPTGSLSFLAGTTAGGDDDNEVALFDYDQDGDYDALIGSLGLREKMLVNDGAGNFTLNTTVIQSISDSTLDVTVADLDNDGAYDIVTAQGESNSAQWANKVYRNTGAPDTLAPVIEREQPLSVRDAAGPWVVHASARDQVLDDGRDWVSASVEYAVLAAESEATIAITAGGWSSSPLAVAPGTLVRWENQDAVAHSVRAASAGYGFDSGPIAPGGVFEQVFVRSGAHAYEDAVGGLAPGQIDVQPGSLAGVATRSAGSLWRFRMDDVLGGAGRVLAYELRFEDWAGNATVSDARCASLAALLYGCGPNPEESLRLLAGKPTIGSELVLGVDNPLGTQAPGSLALVVFSFDSDPAFPCGTLLPGFGMAGVGELLIDLLPPNPVGPILAGVWAGPGQPAPLAFTLPANGGLVGRSVFAQGVLVDPTAPPGGGRFGLAEAIALAIGP